MTPDSLGEEGFLRQVRSGLTIRFGPFRICLRSPLLEAARVFRRLYPDIKLEKDEGIRDFHVEVFPPSGVRRWWRPQVEFRLDGEKPFEPFPRDHAFPLFEWGLNYAIATRAHNYCLLHSAVLEKNGRCLILPALPGSGKSTLCAALMLRGWRLFSDEFGILQPETGRMLPMPRAIPLKNRSIEVIRRFEPGALLGPLFPKTRKGDVAHLAPSRSSLERQGEEGKAGWIVFPRFVPGSSTLVSSVSGSEAFVRLSNNSFNYHLLGEIAFRALTDLVRESECHALRYSDLDEAVAMFDRMVG